MEKNSEFNVKLRKCLPSSETKDLMLSSEYDDEETDEYQRFNLITNAITKLKDLHWRLAEQESAVYFGLATDECSGFLDDGRKYFKEKKVKPKEESVEKDKKESPKDRTYKERHRAYTTERQTEVKDQIMIQMLVINLATSAM